MSKASIESRPGRRDEQMAALESAFASVRQGGPSAVLLGGEAGVGKSGLVSEFGQATAQASARVLTGGCRPRPDRLSRNP